MLYTDKFIYIYYKYIFLYIKYLFNTNLSATSDNLPGYGNNLNATDNDIFIGQVGGNIEKTMVSPDDINNLIFDANNRNLKLITTEKDYVKITENKNHIHFLPIELELSVKDKLNFESFLREKLNAWSIKF